MLEYLKQLDDDTYAATLLCYDCRSNSSRGSVNKLGSYNNLPEGSQLQCHATRGNRSSGMM